MRPSWLQMIYALFLGLALPMLLFRFGSRLQWSYSLPEGKPSGTSQTVPTTDLPNYVQIPVMTAGETEMMDMDTYLIGVVLAEMPASFEPEALKAQTVVARTYAWKRCQDADHHSQGVVCTDPGCCQAYVSIEDYLETLGTREDVLAITQAVLETSGQVLTYNGRLAEATYFSCSGGRTEDAVAVWGADIPYLRSVESPGEENAAVFENTVTFAPAEFAARLGRSLYGDPSEWLGTVTHSAGGGVATMVLAGQTYTGVQLRKLLGLYSTAFTIVVENGELVITTRGKGHRVGMSQYGAEAMAVQGSDYRQILSHYYPGTRIDKTEALG